MFFITCFEKIETDKLGWLDMGAQRVFGYKETFEQTEKALNENWCDMFECLYLYAVVEEIGPGIHPDVRNRWFFKWDNEKNGFFRMDEPEEFKHYTNISIG